jgi:hypothetical protein
MNVALIEGELRTALRAAIDPAWPIRWPNEPWPANIDLSNGNLPVFPNGAAMPCVAVRPMFGKDTAYIAPQGNRLASEVGILKVYLIYPQGIGTAALTAQADAVALAFKRQTIQLDLGQWQRLTTMDPTVDDNEAMVETGDRYVRTVTIPFQFFYRN